MTTPQTISPELQSALTAAAKDGARAFWDGYTINATCHPVGTVQRTAFEVGWTRARDKAVAEGLALPGADNASQTKGGSR